MSSYIRRLPLWLRYLVAVVCAVIIVLALVLYVHHNQQPLDEPAAAGTKQEQKTEMNEDRIIVMQQQAPHVKKLTVHGALKLAASSTITAYMAAQVRNGSINGPIDGTASCAAAGGTASREVVHCNMLAGSVAKNESLRYPFDAVFASATDTLTFCQVVTSPDPSLPSPPVSARCR